ncbi:MAG: 2-oxoacid:acceptor oxidoreductase subunit alpha [Planctomycetaceae bacterium]|nr:2-oxoacid:acceptor oxidoreductase subunit alpha [Planctomycetota bacterium]NUN51304.1 2-oxoacid:acceptor oxidoreductase subunit alpha [Planctomycetaceae bacterium]
MGASEGSGSGVSVPAKPAPKRLESVVIRFAGDSGDGMQLTGSQFTNTSALAGNDIATLPDFPAEIRAPAGTLPGVSGFQVHFSSGDVFTPGDDPDVLVAMNAAALKVNLSTLPKGRIVIVNTDGFDAANLSKSGYARNPLEDGSLDGYQAIMVPLSTLTGKALEGSSLSAKERLRSKNFYALGIMYWLYSRSMEPTEAWIRKQFAKKPEIMEANLTVLKAGYAYALASELFQSRYEVPAAPQAPGLYRNISGNKATALGFYAASVKSGLPLFLGSYPITPASDILGELAKLKPQGVITFQAEDEIAAICSAIGASFGGSLALTTTSGPGLALKAEALGLAITTELPLVVVNVQRGGPSTGLPTKTEQSDLLQALCGRNGESPVAVVAAQTPGDCFAAAFEACRIALVHMTPVVLLTDGYLANGSEPWPVPRVEDLPPIPVKFRTDPAGFQPFSRDPDTLARPWVRPGTPGLEHRIGGLEHQDGSGNVSYDPANHERMTRLREEKIARIARDIPPAEVFGDASGDLLVVGWGGTHGALHAATLKARREGMKVSHMHLRHLNPMPANTGEVLRSFRKVLVAELNRGQLDLLLRARFLVDTVLLSKMQGQPFSVQEIVDAMGKAVAGRPVEAPLRLDGPGNGAAAAGE